MARVSIDLPDFLIDPFGSLAKARQASWLADFPPVTGVVRYEDVRELLSDPRLRANFPEFLQTFGITSGPFYDWMALSPLNRDGADHLRWRGVLSRAFTPRKVEQIRPFLREAAHSLIDGFADRGSCDFVAEFSDAYPSLGMCELIGVPFEDRDRFREWSNVIGLGFSPIELASRIAEVDEALLQLIAYTRDLALKRRAEPRDDLITRISQVGEEDGWTDDMVYGAIAGLVFAGHETTKNQLGWTVAVLSERADIWDSVGNGTLDVADVIEEVLRYRSAVTAVGRKVAEPVERHGVHLAAGDQLLLSLWSADHDEAAFPQAEQVDVKANADTPHIAFGHGPHHCLGAALARAELQEGLLALSSRITCPKVGAGAAWKPMVGINGPTYLPIEFAGRSTSSASR